MKRERRREMRFIFFNAPRGRLWHIVGHGCGSIMIIQTLTQAIELSEHQDGLLMSLVGAVQFLPGTTV